MYIFFMYTSAIAFNMTVANISHEMFCMENFQTKVLGIRVKTTVTYDC